MDLNDKEPCLDGHPINFDLIILPQQNTWLHNHWWHQPNIKPVEKVVWFIDFQNVKYDIKYKNGKYRDSP